MAEASKTGKEAGEAASKSSKLPMIAAVLGALLAGAGGGAFLLRPAPSASGAEGVEEAHEAAGEGEHGSASAGAPQGTTFALEPFLVNLVADSGTRYLKVKIELEVDPPAAKGELESRLPQVRDAVIGLLSSRSFEDVTGFEGKALLKQDVSERVDALLAKGHVKAVLFTEFVVQ